MNRTLHSVRALEIPSSRFARHELIEGWEQERLRALRLVVFGAGALGNEVIKNLALLGVGHLFIVDMDTVESSNLARSVLFRDGDCGRPKAEVAAERAAELHPHVNVETLVGDLHQALGPARLVGYDGVLACLDSVDARMGASRLARRAGVPLWNGGLSADACEITRFGADDGPCYLCTLSTRALRREAQRWSCQGPRTAAMASLALPTTATAAALGGALMAHDAASAAMPAFADRALRAGRRLLLQLAPYQLTHFEIPVNPGCPEHGVFASCSVSETREATGRRVILSAERDPAKVELHFGFDLVLAWRCGCLGGRRPLAPARAIPARCPGCGQRPEDFETAASLPGHHELLNLPLDRLGIPDGGELLLHDGKSSLAVRLKLTPKDELP